MRNPKKGVPRSCWRRKCEKKAKKDKKTCKNGFWISDLGSGPKGLADYAFKHERNFCFFTFSFSVYPQGPGLGALDSDSGPGTRTQGQGPGLGARDPVTGSGTRTRGLRPRLGAGDPGSGPGTRTRGLGPRLGA